MVHLRMTAASSAIRARRSRRSGTAVGPDEKWRQARPCECGEASVDAWERIGQFRGEAPLERGSLLSLGDRVLGRLESVGGAFYLPLLLGLCRVAPGSTRLG